jgi:translocator protein
VRLNLPKLIVSIVLCLGVGAFSSYLTVSAIPTWYATLNKPFFNPPNFVFAPVWTTLYILMGISLYLLWIAKKKGKAKAIKLFLIQLAFNFSWSIVFFGLHNILLAFVEIIALWIFIMLTIRQSLLISKTSAYLLYPYVVWVSFALVLNLFIVILN